MGTKARKNDEVGGAGHQAGHTLSVQPCFCPAALLPPLSECCLGSEDEPGVLTLESAALGPYCLPAGMPTPLLGVTQYPSLERRKPPSEPSQGWEDVWEQQGKSALGPHLEEAVLKETRCTSLPGSGQTWILTGGARVSRLFKGRVPSGNADFVLAAPAACCDCSYSSTGACFSTGKNHSMGGQDAQDPLEHLFSLTWETPVTSGGRSSAKEY